MTAADSSTIAGRKAVIAAFFDNLNRGVHDGSEDWVASLSPRVIDHNKIIFGEADEPGAAIDGFRQQLAAFGPADDGESGMLVQELIAAAKKQPGTLSYSSSGVGSASHLAGALFDQSSEPNLKSHARGTQLSSR